MVLNVAGRTDVALYIPFNEGSGTTVHDYGIDKLSGTMNNDDELWTKNTTGGGNLWHDGNSDYTLFTPTTSLTAYPVTLMSWVRFDSTSSSYTTLSIADSTVSNEIIGIGAGVSTTFKPKITVRTSSSDDNYYGTTTLVANTWYFIAGIFRSATDREVYLNAVSEGSDTDSRAFPSSNIRFGIGARVDSSPSESLAGHLSDSLILNRAISDAELTAIYNATYRE